MSFSMRMRPLGLFFLALLAFHGVNGARVGEEDILSLVAEPQAAEDGVSDAVEEEVTGEETDKDEPVGGAKGGDIINEVWENLTEDTNITNVRMEPLEEHDLEADTEDPMDTPEAAKEGGKHPDMAAKKREADLKDFLVGQDGKESKLQKEKNVLKRKLIMQEPIVAAKMAIAESKTGGSKGPGLDAQGRLLTKQAAKDDKIILAAMRWVKQLKNLMSGRIPGVEPALGELSLLLSKLKPVGLAGDKACMVMKEEEKTLQPLLAPITMAIISPEGARTEETPAEKAVAKALAAKHITVGSASLVQLAEALFGAEHADAFAGLAAVEDDEDEKPAKNGEVPKMPGVGKSTNDLKNAKVVPKAASKVMQQVVASNNDKLKHAAGADASPLTDVPAALAKPTGASFPGVAPGKAKIDEPESGANGVDAVQEAIEDGDPSGEEAIAVAVGDIKTETPLGTKAQGEKMEEFKKKEAAKKHLAGDVPNADKETVMAPLDPEGAKQALAKDEDIEAIPDLALPGGGGIPDEEANPDMPKTPTHAEAAAKKAKVAKSIVTKSMDVMKGKGPLRSKFDIDGVELSESEGEDSQPDDEADKLIKIAAKVSGKGGDEKIKKNDDAMKVQIKTAQGMMLVIQELWRGGCHIPIVLALKKTFKTLPDAEQYRAVKLKDSGEFDVTPAKKPESKQPKKKKNGDKVLKMGVWKAAKASAAKKKAQVNNLQGEVEALEGNMPLIKDPEQKKIAAKKVEAKKKDLQKKKAELGDAKEVTNHAKREMMESANKPAPATDDVGDPEEALAAAKSAKSKAEEKIAKADEMLKVTKGEDGKDDDRKAKMEAAKEANLDCHAELDIWYAAWSEPKKELCCNGKVSCVKPIDDDPVVFKDGKEKKLKSNQTADEMIANLKPNCMSELMVWNHAWSEPKITYCCGNVVQCTDPAMEGETGMLANATMGKQTQMVSNHMGPGGKGQIADKVWRLDPDAKGGAGGEAGDEPAALSAKAKKAPDELEEGTKRAIADIKEVTGKGRFIDYAEEQDEKPPPDCAMIKEEKNCNDTPGCAFSKPELMASLGLGVCEVKK